MSAPIRVAIRADAGAALGMGHFARVSAVADALAVGDDVETLLVTNPEGTAHALAYFPAGTKVVTLNPDEIDAEGSISALDRLGWRPDVILLDQYGSVPQWEAEVAKADARLVVLDDLDAAEMADVIVRPHGGARPENGGILLGGPLYLPLSRHVIRLAKERNPGNNSRPRINICFGGSDPTGETGKAVQAVAKLEQFDIDLVLGPGTQLDSMLGDAVAQLPHVCLHRGLSQAKLAELMIEADIALGAGGVMLWERLCLGIPSLVVSTASNQLPQIDTMIAAAAIRYLGHHSDVSPDIIAEEILSLAADKAQCSAFIDAGRKLVDGRGSLRLAAWVRALALNWRDVQAGDAKDLLDWRTDERNWQHNWGDSDQPEFAAHRAWLGNRIADPECVFRIMMRGNDPVGVVRFDLSDGGISAYLSIYLVPAWHGQRIGLPVYYAAERALRQSHPAVTRIVSRIHKANAASERLHRDAGFEVWPSDERTDWLDAVKLLG